MNRNLDNLGRIVIPKEMRTKLGLKNGDEVKIELDGSKVIITNPKGFDLVKYIENKMIDENSSVEVYRTLNDILDKIRG